MRKAYFTTIRKLCSIIDKYTTGRPNFRDFIGVRYAVLFFP